MDGERQNDNGQVALTVRVYVPEVDADMVPALRMLVIDVFDPFPEARVDVTLQPTRQARQRER